MKTITQEQLINILKNVSGTTFISIETKTDPRLKPSSPFSRVEKVSKVAGAIGFIYGNSVNNQKEREGQNKDFKSKERVWGNRISGTPLVSHQGKMYLEMKVQSSESHYYSNNSEINIDKISGYLYNTSTRQNLEKEVILRDYLLDNITKITINKEEYNVA